MFAWYNLQWILRLPRTSQGQRTILACDNGDLQYSDCVPPILYREDPISSLTRVETSHPCMLSIYPQKPPGKKLLAFSPTESVTERALCYALPFPSRKLLRSCFTLTWTPTKWLRRTRQLLWLMWSWKYQPQLTLSDNGDLQNMNGVPQTLYREDPLSSLTRVETSHPCVCPFSHQVLQEEKKCDRACCETCAVPSVTC